MDIMKDTAIAEMMAQTEAGTEVVPMIVAEILKIVLPPVIEKLIKNLFPLEQHQIRKFGGRRFNFVDANQGEHSNGGQVLHKTSSEAKPAGGGGLVGMMKNAMGGGGSADPTSPDFNYDLMCKEFFGGNFFP